MATPSDRLARVIVKYEVDRASAQAVANSANAVAANMRAVGNAVATAGAQANRLAAQFSGAAAQADQLKASFAGLARQAELDRLAAEMALAAQQGQSLDSIILKVSQDLHRLDANVAEVDQLARAFDRAEKEAREFDAAADAALQARLNAIGTPGGTAALDRTAAGGSGGGRGVFGNSQRGTLGALGQQLFLLPDVGPTTEISRALIIADAAQQAMAKFNVSLSSVAAGALGAGAIIAGLAVIVIEIGKRFEEAKRPLLEFLAVQEDYTKLVVEGSRQDLAAARDAAQAQLDAANLRLGQNRAIVAQFESEVNPFRTGLGQLAVEIARVGDLGGFRQLADQIKEDERLAGEAQRALDTYNAALENNVTATIDAREALLRSAQDAGDDQRELATLLNGTSQQAESRIQQLRAEAAALQASIAVLEESGDTNDKVTQQIDALRTSLSEVTGDFIAANLALGQLKVGDVFQEIVGRIAAAGASISQANRDAAARTGADFQVLSGVLDGTSEAARELVTSLENDAEAARLSAAALESTGDTTKATRDAIAAYNAEQQRSLDLAGRILNIFVPFLEAREEEIRLLERQLQLIHQRVDLEVQAFNTLQSGTVESVDTRIASLNAEAQAVSRSIPQLQALARTNAEFEDELQAAQNRLTAVNQELNLLATIRPDVAARQFREESEKLASQLVKDIARIEAARDNRIAEIEANLGEKEAELAKRRSDDVTDAEEKAAARRLDALEDYREAEARINRKFNRDYLKAVSERDALAAFEAKQQRDDDLADARAKLDKQTAAIDKALKDQQRLIEKRYNDQLQTARAAATRAIQLERDKATAEINLRTQAYNAEIQGLQQSLFAQFALQQQFWAASIAVAQRAVQQVMAQANSSIAQTKYNPVVTTIPGTAPKLTSAPYQYQLPTTYQFRASGGPAEGWTMVGEKGRELVYFPPRPSGPAQVINHRSTEQMMGSTNVSIVIALDGKTLRATSRKEAARLLEQVLKGTGVN